MLFNTLALNQFILPKVCVFRSIVLVMVLAWCIRAVEQWNAGAGSGIAHRLVEFLRRPLVLPAVALAAAYGVSTALSIWPRGSFWGSYNRQQGTYTAICYIALFLVVLHSLRSRAQLERLTTMMVVASLPVCLFALVRPYRLGWEGWSDAFGGGRVSASLGNPIFLGAYVAMVIPLTLSKVISSLEEILRGDQAGIPGVISMILHSFVLCAQVVTLVLTQSRGPLLALLLSLFVFALLFLIQRGRRWHGIVVISLAVAAGLFLITLNLPNTPLGPLKRIPNFRRLGTIANDRSVRFRAAIWETAVRMSTATSLRTLFGHGPETVGVNFYRYITPEAAHFRGAKRAVDRMHNETLDAWATTGLTGVTAQLLLFSSLFYLGFQRLGLTRSRRRRLALGGLMAAGAILGAVTPWILDRSLRFSGIGVPLGLVLGLLLFLAILLFSGQTHQIRDATDLPLIALISGVAAHFAEIQTGIAFTVTRAHFWVYAALVGVLGFSIRGERDPEWDERDGTSRNAHQASIIPLAVLTGLLLVTAGFSLVRYNFGVRSHAYIVLILLMSWLLAGLGLASQSGTVAGESDAQTYIRRLGIYCALSLGSLLAFLPFHLTNLRPYLVPAALSATYYGFVLIALVVVALSLPTSRPLAQRFVERRWWIHPLLVLVVGLILVRTNLNSVTADTFAAVGEEYKRRGLWDQSVSAHERAVELAPGEDRYHLLLGRAYRSQALAEAAEEAPRFERAREAHEVARRLSPLEPDHYAGLGHLYRAWAGVTDDLEGKTERLTQALSYYQQARSMAPLAHGETLKEAAVESHVQLAESYVQLGMVDMAVDQYQAAALLSSPEKRSELETILAELQGDAR
jgi:O-antigen ligase/tetratricopeptide (TPR) repeat protein